MSTGRLNNNLDPLTSKLKVLSTDTAIRGTVIVSSGIFIGSIFAYLLQLFLGRLLTVENFGVFNALLSIYTIIAVISSAFLTALIKLVSNLKAKNDFSTLTYLFSKISIGALLVGAFGFFVILSLKTYLSEFLSIEAHLIAIFGVFIWISLLIIPPSAYLQGLLRFKAFAFWNVLYGILRLAAPVILVYLGYGVGGAYVGIGIAVVLAYIISLLLLKKNFVPHKKLNPKSHYSNVVGFVGVVLFVNVALSFLNNIDIILVKHYFSPLNAGLYSGVVTVGKVLLFGAGTVSVVMFPQISAAFAKGEDYFKKFRTFLIIQMVIVVLGVAFFSIFPEFVTKLMFGESYLPAVTYLPKFAFFVGEYVLISFFVLFFLAIEKTKIFFFQFPLLVLQLLLLTLFHSNLHQVILVNIGVASLLLFFLVIYWVRNARISNSSGV